MNHLGTPKHTQSFKAYMILTEYFWEIQFKILWWNCCQCVHSDRFEAGMECINFVVELLSMSLILTGLKQAWNVLRAGSRYRTSNSLRLVVLVTDGAWTVGGDPISVVSKMKADMASDGVRAAIGFGKDIFSSSL